METTIITIEIEGFSAFKKKKLRDIDELTKITKEALKMVLEDRKIQFKTIQVESPLADEVTGIRDNITLIEIIC